MVANDGKTALPVLEESDEIRERDSIGAAARGKMGRPEGHSGKYAEGLQWHRNIRVEPNTSACHCDFGDNSRW